jgi:hypothetical protein
MPEGSSRDFRFSFRFCGVREGIPDLLYARSLARSARIASRAALTRFEIPSKSAG